MESRYFPCTGLKILERNTDIKMKKKNLKLLWMVMVVGALLGGCGGKVSRQQILRRKQRHQCRKPLQKHRKPFRRPL